MENPLDQPHLRRFAELLTELESESPRGAVLVSATLLDEQLAECLLSRFIDHPDAAKLVEGFNAPLGTFAARILAAFAAGCISDREYRDLEAIRRIRNDFAHKLSISFDDASIKDRCATLTFAAQDYADVRVSARGRFTTAATALILNLVNRPHYLAGARTTPQP
jgi:DNA-binding MltR family transcriptional regulator